MLTRIFTSKLLKLTKSSSVTLFVVMGFVSLVQASPCVIKKQKTNITSLSTQSVKQPLQLTNAQKATILVALMIKYPGWPG